MAKNGEAKPLHNIETVGREYEKHPVKLSEVERLTFADKLASIEDELTSFEAEAEGVKKSLKAREATILAHRSELAGIVRSRSELRDVEITMVANYTAGTLSKVRKDTGETVASRRLTDGERQEGFPEFEPEKKAASQQLEAPL